ncbi:hypothetical protein ACEWY4_023577 [Coilia grayii]|uniref:DUF4806 domain-containing protein n=1 Tax=Coilia grayii TaxID=363190 RepID=A0ABD1J3E9_9TELE
MAGERKPGSNSGVRALERGVGKLEVPVPGEETGSEEKLESGAPGENGRGVENPGGGVSGESSGGGEKPEKRAPGWNDRGVEAPGLKARGEKAVENQDSSPDVDGKGGPEDRFEKGEWARRIRFFTETDEIEVVPNDWLSLDKMVTFWPPYKSSKCSAAVIKNEVPDEEHLCSIILNRKKSSRVAVEMPLTPVPPEMPQYVFLYISFVINYEVQHMFDQGGKLYKLLEEINGQVRQNTLLLQALHKKQNAADLGEVDFDFPLTTFTCVRNIENWIANNQEAKRSLTRYLCSLGGATPKDILNRILRHIINDELARKFNWRGRGAKSPFSALCLAKVVIGTVTTITLYDNTNVQKC